MINLGDLHFMKQNFDVNIFLNKTFYARLTRNHFVKKKKRPYFVALEFNEHMVR